MVKQKCMAKVQYNEREDSFELWIRTNEKEEWGFCRSAQCRAIGDETETNFINFTFLKEVLKCIKLGYEVFEA